MKKELLEISNMLIPMVSKNSIDAIKTYKKLIVLDKINSARIVSDELVDYLVEIDDNSDRSKKSIKLAQDLYDKTMEHLELNS